jgi:GT2 family glycosyltransferase
LPVQALRLKELLYPVGATAGDPAPARAEPGQVETVPLAAVPLIYGDRERLCELGRRDPQALLGGDAGALAAGLQQQGLRLGCAADVGVYRLAQIAGDGDARLAARYLAQQGANLGYERRYEEQGGAPMGLLTRAQTELVSVVVVVAADGDLAAARAGLDAIYRHTQRSLEVIVVDSRRDDRLQMHAASLPAQRGHLSYLRAHPDAGVGHTVNLGLAGARGEYLALLRDDVLVTPGWLSRLLALMAIDPALALVGPAIGGLGEGAQDAGIRTYSHADELPLFAGSWALTHQGELAVFSPLSGACLVMRRQVVARVGGFDPRFADGVHGDQDFCVRAARAGFRMGIAFDALVHRAPAPAAGQRSVVDGERARAAGWQSFCEKWGHPIEARAPAALRALGAKPFDPGRDYVPLPVTQPFVPQLAAEGKGHP